MLLILILSIRVFTSVNGFQNLKSFLDMAEAEGRSLTSLYSEVV